MTPAETLSRSKATRQPKAPSKTFGVHTCLLHRRMRVSPKRSAYSSGNSAPLEKELLKACPQFIILFGVLGCVGDWISTEW